MSSVYDLEFLDALKRRKDDGGIPLIPDIKCFSPKEGDLMMGRDPVLLARQLEQAGACAVSVVTETKEFHGSMELLKQVCTALKVPVLRKDFITCEADLDETKAAGAKAILLMVSCLGEERLTTLYHAALKKGLTPFVETHTPKELEFAVRLKAPLVGINNRDITVLERDDGTVAHASEILRQAGRQEGFVVVESALRDGDDVRKAIRYGADAALVGTAILKAGDPVKQYLAMTRSCGLKICGLMSEADVDACLSHQVDMCGFVVDYPVPVRWNLEAERAKQLLRYAGDRAKTCIVTGGDAEKVLDLARSIRPDFVQLHYKESLEETKQIAEALAKEEDPGQDRIRVIRSIPGDGEQRRAMFGTDSLPAIAELLAHSAVAGVLLDSRDAGNAAVGGGSLVVHMDLAEHGTAELSEMAAILADAGKLLLAGGGITPDNAKLVRNRLHPDYLDIMTGAEDEKGNKSEVLIGQLAEEVR